MVTNLVRVRVRTKTKEHGSGGQSYLLPGQIGSERSQSSVRRFSQPPRHIRLQPSHTEIEIKTDERWHTGMC